MNEVRPVLKDVRPSLPPSEYHFALPHSITVATTERKVPAHAQSIRSEQMELHKRPITSEQGSILGSVYEATVETHPGETEAQFTFSFPLDRNHEIFVTREGWNSWSTPSKPKGFVRTDMLIGTVPLDEAIQGKTFPFVEPVAEKQDLAGTGRSYGMVNFEDGVTGQNTFIGTIPDLETVEDIRFHPDGDRMVITITKHLDGAQEERPRTFRLFLGTDNPRDNETGGDFSELVVAYGQELAKLKSTVFLMHDRVIGFSWAAHGAGINEQVVTQEIDAARRQDETPMVDTYIIDDGWEKAHEVMTVNTAKFPHMQALTTHMKDSGIKPGIWVAPFIVRSGALESVPENFLLKGPDGGPIRIPTPIMKTNDASGIAEQPYGLDISKSEVRQFIVNKFRDLAGMGFETFKVDFLSAPFMAALANNDKTSVEYYRQAITEIRQGVRDILGKEGELIGCGAPIMESIGLFEGMRITHDSAAHNLRHIPALGKLAVGPLRPLYYILNNGMYRNAIEVAEKRAPLLSQIHGIVLDGIHLNDPHVPLLPLRKGLKDRLAKRASMLKGFGASISVGDSLSRIGKNGRQEWDEFIHTFQTTDSSLSSRRNIPLPQ